MVWFVLVLLGVVWCVLGWHVVVDFVWDGMVWYSIAALQAGQEGLGRWLLCRGPAQEEGGWLLPWWSLTPGHLLC